MVADRPFSSAGIGVAINSSAGANSKGESEDGSAKPGVLVCKRIFIAR